VRFKICRKEKPRGGRSAERQYSKAAASISEKPWIPTQKHEFNVRRKDGEGKKQERLERQLTRGGTSSSERVKGAFTTSQATGGFS